MSQNYKLMEKFLSTAGLIILDLFFGFAIEIGICRSNLQDVNISSKPKQESLFIIGIIFFNLML